MVWADMQNAYHYCETRKIDEKKNMKSYLACAIYRIWFYIFNG